MKKTTWIIENKITGKQQTFNDFKVFESGCKGLMTKEVDKMFCVKMVINGQTKDEAEIKDYFNC